MATKTIYARVNEDIGRAFLLVALKEKRTVTAQLEIILADWLASHPLAGDHKINNGQVASDD